MANLKEHIEDIIKFLRSIEFQIDPIPNIKIDDTENSPDDIFIKTGYYDGNSIVLCTSNRHIKDILRTFCHEIVHHYQHLRDPENYQNLNFEGSIYDNKGLKDMEREAYEKGNLLFRLYTEYKQGKVVGD